MVSEALYLNFSAEQNLLPSFLGFSEVSSLFWVFSSIL
jgi:hypothetical protein